MHLSLFFCIRYSLAQQRHAVHLRLFCHVYTTRHLPNIGTIEVSGNDIHHVVAQQSAPARSHPTMHWAGWHNRRSYPAAHRCKFPPSSLVESEPHHSLHVLFVCFQPQLSRLPLSVPIPRRVAGVQLGQQHAVFHAKLYWACAFHYRRYLLHYLLHQGSTYRFTRVAHIIFNVLLDARKWAHIVRSQHMHCISPHLQVGRA
mmetsp:Transcript_28163/g.71800  ORF Transcript_28163/g.71800 Transcript_28163/m.71800 type:complete len:201 (+) Transcript_28163:5144-5746(+)